MSKLTKLNLKKQTLKNVVLRIFAASVLCVWLGNAVVPPLVALAADESCQLSCCQGLARHLAGSCVGGACHLKAEKKSSPHEIICGAKELAEKQIAASKHKITFVSRRLDGVPVFDETQNANSHDGDGSPLVRINAAEQFCQTVCSISSNFHSSQQNQRADDRAALNSFDARPRPPTIFEIEFSNRFAVKISRQISRRVPARAPPISFA